MECMVWRHLVRSWSTKLHLQYLLWPQMFGSEKFDCVWLAWPSFGYVHEP